MDSLKIMRQKELTDILVNSIINLNYKDVRIIGFFLNSDKVLRLKHNKSNYLAQITTEILLTHEITRLSIDLETETIFIDIKGGD